jgi:hypothetical protein
MSYTSKMSDNSKITTIDYKPAEKWMRNNFPNCRRLDVNWTMERYDYPDYVREWIKETWFKESDDNGGTYVYTYDICKDYSY